MTIDIMMPFYGDPVLLRDAVRSVVCQASDGWHLTVIDDHYPDPEPGRWVESLADPNVSYVRNPQNLGVTGNFQRSIELATADHVVIMGCDDIMRADYVAKMRALIDRYPDASYFQPGVAVIGADGRERMPLADRLKARLRPHTTAPTVLSGEPLAAGLLRGNWTYFPSICWRRDRLASYGFREEYGVVLDLALQLDIVLDGGTLALDDATTFEYRRHEASVSSWTATDGTRFAEEAALFAHTAQRCDDMGWHHAERAARRHWTSRLNAVTRLAAAAAHGDMAGIRSLMKHIVR